MKVKTTPRTTGTATTAKQQQQSKKELLLHKSAAILMLLEEHGLSTTAKKLRTRFCKNFGVEELPETLSGEWKWHSKSEETESSSEEESEEESSTEESSSADESLSNVREEDEEAPTELEAPPVSSNAKRRDFKRASSMRNVGLPNEPRPALQRAVSFSKVVEERFMSPRLPYKKALYYNRSELRQFRQEASQEKLDAAIAAASATLGIKL